MSQHGTAQAAALRTPTNGGGAQRVGIGDLVAIEFPDGSRASVLVPEELEVAESSTDAARPDAALLRALVGAEVGERVTVCSDAGVYSATIRGRSRVDARRGPREA